MTRYLVIHVPDNEPYPVDSDDELAEAIENEARTIAEDAGSDEIDDPSEETREKYKDEIQGQAQLHLVHYGRYTDPNRVLWTLEEHEPGSERGCGDSWWPFY